MSPSLNLSLTDELREFVDQHSGDGTMHETPSEFVQDLLRQKRLQLEAQKLHEGILEGLQDLADGRLTKFSGSVSDIKRIGPAS